MNPELKQHTKDQTAKFTKYENSCLYYKTSSGLEFPISIMDIGNAKLPGEASAMLFIRWIRKHLEH